MATPPPPIVDHLIVGDAIEPRREGDIAELKHVQVPQRFHEHFRGEILGDFRTTVHTIDEVAVDLGAKQLIQLTDGCLVV